MKKNAQTYIFGEQPDQEPDREGEWFLCYGWRVFPRTLKKKFDALIRVNDDAYNNQFDWSFENEVRAANQCQALEIAEEFFRATRHASNHRPLLSEISDKKLSEHGWKHFTHEDLIYLGQRALNPQPDERLRAMKPSEVKELLLRVVRRDPMWVALLCSCVPEKIERKRMAKKILGSYTVLPSVGDLAADYMETICRIPRSPEAGTAEDNLMTLLSAVAGRSRKRGPKARLLDKGYFYEAYLVACALARQIREVSALASFEKDREIQKRFVSRLLLQLYPWLSKVSADEEKETGELANTRRARGRDSIQRLIEIEPSKAAKFIRLCTRIRKDPHFRLLSEE